jgi:hypothetical protein
VLRLKGILNPSTASFSASLLLWYCDGRLWFDKLPSTWSKEINAILQNRRSIDFSYEYLTFGSERHFLSLSPPFIF